MDTFADRARLDAIKVLLKGYAPSVPLAFGQGAAHASGKIRVKGRTEWSLVDKETMPCLMSFRLDDQMAVADDFVFIPHGFLS